MAYYGGVIVKLELDKELCFLNKHYLRHTNEENKRLPTSTSELYKHLLNYPSHPLHNGRLERE